MGLFVKSVAAANAFPDTLRAILSGLYGEGTSPRLRSQSMEFAVWTFKHASQVRRAARAQLRCSKR